MVGSAACGANHAAAAPAHDEARKRRHGCGIHSGSVSVTLL